MTHPHAFKAKDVPDVRTLVMLAGPVMLSDS